eukprot:scaffold137_cov398-Prasinococcus_capsulatus_cf.AAC.45
MNIPRPHASLVLQNSHGELNLSYRLSYAVRIGYKVGLGAQATAYLIEEEHWARPTPTVCGQGVQGNYMSLAAPCCPRAYHPDGQMKRK